MTRRASIKRCPDDRGHPKILLLCDLSAMLLPSSRLSRTEPIMFTSGPSTHPTPNFPLCDLCAMLSLSSLLSRAESTMFTSGPSDHPLSNLPPLCDAFPSSRLSRMEPPCSPAVPRPIQPQISPSVTSVRCFPLFASFPHGTTMFTSDPSTHPTPIPLCDLCAMLFPSSRLSRTEPPWPPFRY